MKKILYEVSIIRPLVIFLLVLMHSFTMYGGGWTMPEGIIDVRAYYWLAKFITGFRIETIAMVAGYVFSFQSFYLDRKYELKSFMTKKFKRLILPALFFGVFYYFIFMYDANNFNAIKFIIRLFSGVGHLWFLPMLFWLYLFIWIIDHYKINSMLFVVSLAIISIVPIPITLPFGLGKFFHFAFYGYLGYAMFQHKDCIKRFITRKHIILLITIYVISVYVNYQYIIVEGGNMSLYAKIINRLTANSISFISTMSGIFALYLIVIHFTDNKGVIPHNWVIESSKICYGVYVFHQFILIYLYYHTFFPLIMGTYWMPIVGFLITIILSIILASLTLRTKCGRFLIG